MKALWQKGACLPQRSNKTEGLELWCEWEGLEAGRSQTMQGLSGEVKNLFLHLRAKGLNTEEFKQQGGRHRQQ